MSKLLVASSLALAAFMANACGSSSKSSDTPAADTSTGTTTVTYSQVATIISASCAGSSCHSTGSSYGVFVGNEANVNASKSDIYTRVNNGTMPPSGSLAASDKATILSDTKQ